MFGNPLPRIKSSDFFEIKEKSFRNSGVFSARGGSAFGMTKDFDADIGEIRDFRPEKGFLNMLWVL